MDEKQQLAIIAVASVALGGLTYLAFKLRELAVKHNNMSLVVGGIYDVLENEAMEAAFDQIVADEF